MNTASLNQPSFRIDLPRLQLPAIRGNIERRLLVNYRCDADVIARLLPDPFRPKLVEGFAIAGICMIRLTEVRPAFVPVGMGITSENAAHRIAVEWDEAGAVREGVFIPRRDTNSRLNQLAGGRFFSGVHHAATFRVWETGSRFKVEMRSKDGAADIRVLGRVAEELPTDSVFQTLDEASNFFLSGALGWSARLEPDQYDGLELECGSWSMEPLVVEHVQSSFFNDTEIFPPATATFDSAFLMRNIPHRWWSRGRMFLNREEAV